MLYRRHLRQSITLCSVLFTFQKKFYLRCNLAPPIFFIFLLHWLVLEVRELHLSSTKVMNVYTYTKKYIAFHKLYMYVHTADMTWSLEYTRNAPLAVIGEQQAAERCSHCLCSQYVIQQPPSFLVGSSAPVEGNSVHRFHLYQ